MGRTQFAFRSIGTQVISTMASIYYITEEHVPWSDQPVVDYIGNNVEVKVAVIDNLNKIDNYVTMELHLKNTGSDAIHSGTWKIYMYR